MTADRPRVALGRVVAAHGVKGDVLIETYTGDPRDIASYGPLADERGAGAFEVKVTRETPKGVVAHIKGVEDRNGAEALAGTVLTVARERLPLPEGDAYYHVDLVGLAAVDAEGKMLGLVTAVVNYGAGDLLEIRLDGARTTELVPFTAAFAPKVDLAAGRVVVILPAAAGAEKS